MNKRVRVVGMVLVTLLIFMTFYWTRYQVVASPSYPRFFVVNRWTGEATVYNAVNGQELGK